MDELKDGKQVEGSNRWIDKLQKKKKAWRLSFCGNFNKDKSDHIFIINSKWVHIEYIPDAAFTLATPYIYKPIEHEIKLKSQLNFFFQEASQGQDIFQVTYRINWDVQHLHR